jgi:hypothetical protein
VKQERSVWTWELDCKTLLNSVIVSLQMRLTAILKCVPPTSLSISDVLSSKCLRASRTG